MQEPLDKLKETWQTLGQEDPLWAIASVEGKRGGKWDVPEFLEVGERAVNDFHALLKREVGAPDRFRHVLDFGCGVGRLSHAWAKRAEAVTGVDISKPMVERGTALLRDVANLRLQLNEASDLACFQSGTFDLVFSHACLQHMPWSLAAGYIKEFARVCSPGGWVVFSLPARVLDSTWPRMVRQKLVDLLPFGLGSVYRRWRHGSAAVFEMHFTPTRTVEAALKAAGLRVLRCEPDQSAGPNAEGHLYIASQPSPASRLSKQPPRNR
jgi:SAM-dependent methyltransferase